MTAGDRAKGGSLAIPVDAPVRSSPFCAPARSLERDRFDTLATREREVFALLAQGYSAPEIGTRLGISAKTVYSYKARIAEKVGVSHRSQYVQVALRMGWLAIPRAQGEPRQLPGVPPAQR
jgi:DNA-binding NarL/FixJ family response regulator